MQAAYVLVAVGRAPVTEGIGREAASVQVQRGFIPTNARLQTNVPSRSAVGDATRLPLLAQSAWAAAAAAVGAIAQDPSRAGAYSNIADVTACHREVVSVGLTETAARAERSAMTVGTFHWHANGRARGTGTTDGFTEGLPRGP